MASDEMIDFSDVFITLDRAGTRSPEHPTHPDISLLSPDFYADPEPLYAWMRTNAPVYWDDATGIWGLASHEHVSFVTREWETFCSGQGSRPDSNVPSSINFDPPAHSVRRGIVKAGFTLRKVQGHEQFLRAKVTELIDAVVERGECDFVADLAKPLPMYMIAELMGLPEADHDMVLEWSDIFATGGDDLRGGVENAIREYTQYILDAAGERRGRPGEDLVTLLANAEENGCPVSDRDFVFETMLILVGGDETTRHVMSGGLAAVLARPEQRRRLQADLTMLPTAIEEMLRWVTPVKNMNRTATRDVELGGQLIREGDRMLLLYHSANRDEAVFDEPTQFDIERTPNPHVAFGAYGRHNCLGNQLARLELRVLFEELFHRLPDIELADPDQSLPQRRGNFVLGIESMPVRFSPARPSQ